MATIIRASDFTFTYPGAEEPALQGLSFEIEQGGIVGIIGPVGAGKTTLCMAIAGFAPRIVGGEASGELHVGESKPGEKSDESEGRKVGMVFEDYAAQLTQLKVLDEVKVPLVNRGASREEAEEQSRELMSTVGLNSQEIEGKRIWELSAGQQQRLAIAATLAIDPQVLILDNVMDRLDPQGQQRIRDVIDELSGEKTLLIVHHDTELMLHLADHLLVLADGKLIAQGAPDEILRNPDLLEQADIAPPASMQVAQALNLSRTPLTPEEFEQAVGQADTHRGKTPSDDSQDGKTGRIAATKAYQPSDDSQDGKTGGIAVTKVQQPEERQTKGRRPGKPARITAPTIEQPEVRTAEDEHHPDDRTPIVHVEGVTFCYPDGTRALEDVNIHMGAGEVHAIIGPSGAGKTTLIKHIVGLLEATDGRVSVCGIDTRNRDVTELAQMIGTVLQNPDEQISERTVRDEIGFPLKQRQHERTGLFSQRKRYDDDYIEEQVAHACDLLGIDEDMQDEDPVLLPAGLRKIVTIAEALVVDPAVLLLDEPTVGLGVTSRNKISQLLTRLREAGKAVLLADNNVNFVAEVADTVTVLHQGRAVLQGPVARVFAEENWDQLGELHIRPPHVAELAQRIGLDALTVDELVAQLSAKEYLERGA